MTGAPPEALDLAADVICDWYCGTDPDTCLNRVAHLQLAEGILLAAAPDITAAERERCAALLREDA